MTHVNTRQERRWTDRVLGSISQNAVRHQTRGCASAVSIERPFIAKYDRRSFSVWSQGLKKSQTLRQEQRHAEERKIDIVLANSKKVKKEMTVQKTRQTHSELGPKTAGEWRLHMQIRLIRPVSDGRRLVPGNAV